MATIVGSKDPELTYCQGSNGRFVTIYGYLAALYPNCITWYKCKAYDSTAGWVSWVNNNGSTTNRPAAVGSFGDTQIVATWCVSHS